VRVCACVRACVGARERARARVRVVVVVVVAVVVGGKWADASSRRVRVGEGWERGGVGWGGMVWRRPHPRAAERPSLLAPGALAHARAAAADLKPRPRTRGRWRCLDGSSLVLAQVGVSDAVMQRHCTAPCHTTQAGRSQWGEGPGAPLGRLGDAGFCLRVARLAPGPGLAVALPARLGPGGRWTRTKGFGIRV
jgi:hypothetical protein